MKHAFTFSQLQDSSTIDQQIGQCYIGVCLYCHRTPQPTMLISTVGRPFCVKTLFTMPIN